MLRLTDADLRASELRERRRACHVWTAPLVEPQTRWLQSLTAPPPASAAAACPREAAASPMKKRLRPGRRSTIAEAEVAGEPQRQGVVGEQPVQPVGGRRHGEAVEPAGALVGAAARPGRRDRARGAGRRSPLRPAPRRPRRPRLRPWPGDRVDDVGGIAEQRQALGPEAPGDAEGQRVRRSARAPAPARPRSRVNRRSISASTASGSPESRASASSARSVQTIEERWPSAPPSRRGRIAKGPAGRKCSTARPSCGRAWPIVATMPDLRIGPADPADPRRLAQARARPVGGHQQVAPQALARRQRRADRRALRHRPHHARRDERDARRPAGLATAPAPGARPRPCGRRARPPPGRPGPRPPAEGQEDRPHRVGEPAVADHHLGDRLGARPRCASHSPSCVSIRRPPAARA